jgi:tetratricopeptide (TPR) repeat protein
MNLDLLRRKRVQRMNQHLRKSSVSNYSMMQRVFTIFYRAMRRFSNDINLWLQFLDWAIGVGSTKQVTRLFPRALALHPLVPALWVKAALYEFKNTGNIDAARIYFQRGLRLNPSSKLLWYEFFRMEMQYIGRIAKRKALLGFIPSVPQLAEYKARIAQGDDAPADDNLMSFETTKPFDPADLMPLSEGDQALLSGVIPRTVFKNACLDGKLKDDITFRLGFLSLVAEWYKGTEPRNLAQAMTHRAMTPKAFATPAAEIQVDVECLLVAGVNMEELYDVIFASCKADFAHDPRFWAAYSRAPIILYNPVMPATLEELRDEARAKIQRTADEPVPEESPLWSMIPQYLNDYADKSLSAMLAFAGPEAVSVARLEEAFSACPSDAAVTQLIAFSRERMAEYSSLSSPDAARVAHAYKAVVVEMCRRAAALGVAGPQVFQQWLDILQLTRAPLGSLAVPEVQKGEQGLQKVVISPADARTMSAVLVAAEQANALSGACAGVNPRDTLNLWNSVILLFTSAVARGMLSASGASADAREQAEQCYRAAIQSVSLEHAAELWANYLVFLSTHAVAAAVSDEDALEEERERIAEVFTEALNFYVSARPNQDVSAIASLISSEGAFSVTDYSLHQRNAADKQAAASVAAGLDRIKQQYMTWAMATAALPIPSQDRDAKESAATLLITSVDTVLHNRYAPHSLSLMLTCLDAEVAAQRLLHQADAAGSQPSLRLKSIFERAVQDFGTVSVALWLRYLRFIVPAPHNASTFADPSLGAVAAVSADVDEVAGLYWRALKVLEPQFRGQFTSEYEKMVHKHD